MNLPPLILVLGLTVYNRQLSWSDLIEIYPLLNSTGKLSVGKIILERSLEQGVKVSVR